VAWWRQSKEYTPEEASLVRGFRRLSEIIDELREQGDAIIRLGQGANSAEVLTAFPTDGGCGYKLCVEAYALCELLYLRIARLRAVDAQQGEVTVEDLGDLQRALDELAPQLLKRLIDLSCLDAVGGRKFSAVVA
jgi:predicted NBD/HSP70 family sugar kinase